jgi:hypothetical protein
MKCYCWASGLIEFGRSTPEGAILIHSGPVKRLRKVVEVLARHGYGASQGKLLVPGVPEAGMSGQDPVQCLINFAKLVAERLPA